MLLGGIELEIMTDLTKLPQKVASAVSALENKEIVGVCYETLAYVGKQIVDGTNYHFIAKQTLVLKNPIQHIVKITVNEKGGKYEVVKGSIEYIY